MASANASPISGSELVRVIQGGFGVWLNRNQFAQLAALAPVYAPRPFLRPTTLTGAEQFEALQNGTRITMNAADIQTWLSGTAPIPVAPGTQATQLSGQEVVSAVQAMYHVGLNVTDVATVRGGGGPVTDLTPGGGGGTPAPSFSAAPSISPNSGTANTTSFTRTAGAVSNGSVTSWQWRLSGSVIAGSVASVTPVSAGTLTVTDTASGAGGTVSASSAGVSVSPPFSGTGWNDAANWDDAMTWSDAA